MTNKWINTSDFKDWYLESFPEFNLCDVRFSLNDIFSNLNEIPGVKFKFKKFVYLEPEDLEEDINVEE